MNSVAIDIRTGTIYPNVATEIISDIRTGTTYPTVATEFISDMRTETTYPNVAHMSSSLIGKSFLF
jgi:hypothetical protein